MKALERYSRWFLTAAGLLLLAAAMTRFLAAAGDSQMLGLPDPVLGLSVRSTALAAGLIELLSGLICLFAKRTGLRASLVAWLMTNWAIYKAGLLYMSANVRYTGLGMLTDPLDLSNFWLERLPEILALSLLAGGYVTVILTWASRPKRRQDYFKVACPGCGGHIEFPAGADNRKIACPHCGGGIRLQYLPKIV